MASRVGQVERFARSDGRAARRARAIESGREMRRRNREFLDHRERELNPPSTPLVEGLKTFLLAALFLPLALPIISLSMWFHRLFGATGAWLAGVLGVAGLAMVVYHGPRLVRAAVRDFRGVFRGWRRDPATFVLVLFLLIGVPLVLLFGGLHWKSL